jgi:hypothetical protein
MTSPSLLKTEIFECFHRACPPLHQSPRFGRHFDSELPWLLNAQDAVISRSGVGKLCIEKVQFCVELAPICIFDPSRAIKLSFH